MSILSNWRNRQARSRAKVEASKRIRVLKPSAREVFAVRFQTTESRVNKHGVTRTVLVTQPWPQRFTADDVLARVNSAGIR
jgi:hypothetical protein